MNSQQAQQFLLQALLGLTQQTPTVASTSQYIKDFHQFILNNVPYGQVDLSSVQQGLIELDGPGQQGLGGKKPLQWHFGGAPYEIAKAARIQYTYKKMYQGFEQDATGNLLIGYHLLPQTKQVGAEGRDPAPPRSISEEFHVHADNEVNMNIQAGNLLQVTDQLTKAIRAQLVFLPSTVISASEVVKSFDQFIQDNDPRKKLELVGDPNRVALKEEPFLVEYDGPAQKNNSASPFLDTALALFSDAIRYRQLLHWYFGGNAYQVTKAIRVRWKKDNNESLLIGYQGPQPYDRNPGP
jgi:hypothetical protein